MKAKGYNMGRYKLIQCVIKPLLLTLDSDMLNWCTFRITTKWREMCEISKIVEERNGMRIIHLKIVKEKIEKRASAYFGEREKYRW